uniref:Uncharacterized protein n=1 Tax=Rhizophora mucronata TaxID=61149 RepID=A0A2P2Q5K8_RHIMU
MKFKKLRLCF